VHELRCWSSGRISCTFGQRFPKSHGSLRTLLTAACELYEAWHIGCLAALLMRPSSRDNLWTIVLAAGDVTRLRSLTRALHGEELPKQFALIQEGRSLLQTTMTRAASASSRSTPQSFQGVQL